MIRFLVVLAALAVPGILAQRCLRNNVDASLLEDDVNENLYHGQTAFTFNMLGSICKKSPRRQNIFFSPYSTYRALLLTYLGATNRAERELSRVLGLQWATCKEQVSYAYRLEKQRRTERLSFMPLDFTFGDKIIFDKHIKVGDCWMDQFMDEIGTMDLSDGLEDDRLEINSWFSKVANDDQDDIFGPMEFNMDSQLLLTSGAYFKGQWMSQFDSQFTTQAPFYLSTGEQSAVQMMHKRGAYKYTTLADLGARVVILPYLTDRMKQRASEISMVTFLPLLNDELSLTSLLAKMTAERLEATFNQCEPMDMEISFPKFDLEQNLELVPVLRDIGLNSIFDDKTALSGFSSESNLVLRLAKHVARIKVDEHGSSVTSSYRRSMQAMHFNCNRPFLFLVYDHAVKAVLFSGIYRNPRG